MNAPIITVPISHFSDGDPNHRPTRADYSCVNPPSLYLEKLAKAWLEKRGVPTQPGMKYMLDRLPNGYEIWERPRPGGPKHVDKWCFGHPSHRSFDSPNRFLPHFLHLMEHGNAPGCPCILCPGSSGAAKSSKQPPLISTSQAPAPNPSTLRPAVFKPKGRNWIEGRSDDEGSPDVYRNLIDKLKAAGSLDQPITETMSMDWRAEKEPLNAWFSKLSLQPSWIPRQGELVLYAPSLLEDEEIRCDGVSRIFKIWSESRAQWRSLPPWEAGVVTQTPEEEVHIQDLAKGTRKEYSVTYSGFRVEALPDPNSSDKSYSTQHKYVRPDQMRPLSIWHELLSGTPKGTWHPTVFHAHVASSTIALVGRYRFKGKWPNAKIFCRGMFLGAEFIREGDTVRLLPNVGESERVTDILKITSITLDLSKLDTASNDDYDDGHPYQCSVSVKGKMFTLNKARAIGPQTVDPDLLPENYDTFGKWYYRHTAKQSAVVPFHRVIGRCLELEATGAWLLNSNPNGVEMDHSWGLKGVRESRQYSSRVNRYIPVGQDESSWFWADTRVEALDLHEVNGYQVSSRDPERDTKQWRKEIRIMQREARSEEQMAMQSSQDRRQPAARMTVSNARIDGAMDATGGTDDELLGRDTSRDRKRDRSVMENSPSDDENDEEDRFMTSMAQDVGPPMGKKLVSEERRFEKSRGTPTDTPRGRQLQIVID